MSGQYQAKRRVPLSEANVGTLKIDPALQNYLDNLYANCQKRLQVARQGTKAKEMIHRIHNSAQNFEVESPWTCSKMDNLERDHTVDKSEANKDTTVGTSKDIASQQHYRSKLSDLWTAAFSNELEEVNLYIDCGADANAKNSLGGNCETPLHDAALGGHLEMIELLVQRGGADVNALDNVGNTPLHMAARAGCYDAAMRLLDFQANALAKNDSHHTPWMVAHLAGHTKLRDQLPKPHNYSTRVAQNSRSAIKMTSPRKKDVSGRGSSGVESRIGSSVRGGRRASKTLRTGRSRARGY